MDARRSPSSAIISSTPTTKRNLLGVLVDQVSLDEARSRILEAARAQVAYGVSALAVHGLVTGARDPSFRQRLNSLELVVPDGQPVRWLMNLAYGSQLRSSVRGTDLTVSVLRGAGEAGMAVYLYGSTLETNSEVAEWLHVNIAGLRVVGARPSQFRAIDRVEFQALAEDIRTSGAQIVLVGLGCPRQEIFVHELTGLLGLPALAVGAAFDYLAGRLPQPPTLLRRFGLEWAWRLGLEPRRLWRRYVLLNPIFVGLSALQLIKLWRPSVDGPVVPLERIDA